MALPNPGGLTLPGPGDLLLGKPPVEGVGVIWGKRPEARRTEGTPDRTYAIALIHAVRLDIEALGTPTRHPETGALTPDPDFAVPELGVLADLLPNAWAGHGGKDNDRLIQAVEAATATTHQTTNNQARPDES